MDWPDNEERMEVIMSNGNTGEHYKTRVQTPKKSYTFDYQPALDYADNQAKIFWTADEINVEKDIQDIKVNMTEAEAHGVITTLRLFTLYELVAGRDYWLNRVMKRFPRPDIERMASTFGFFELNVHAPFYNKINEALMLNTDEFYMSYVDDLVLKDRMDYIESIVCEDDDLVSLGAFSMVEGAVLYSSFAFLKHFQAKGKNKLLNVVRGINFSVRDENLHAEGGAWLYRTLLNEKLVAGTISQEEVENLSERLRGAANAILKHEYQIIDMVFEKGDIEGINKKQMRSFVRSRLELCLNNLGISGWLAPKTNPIGDWFYDNINQVKIHDFFTGIDSSYNRNWNQGGFTW